MAASPRAGAGSPLSSSDLELVAALFDAIRELTSDSAAALSSDAAAAAQSAAERARSEALRLDQFKAHLHSTVSTLHSALLTPALQQRPCLRRLAVLRSKRALYSACGTALTAHATVLDPKLGDVVRRLRTGEGEVAEQAEALVEQSDSNAQSRAEQLESELAQAQSELASLRRASSSSSLDVSALSHQLDRDRAEARLSVERDAYAREKKSLVQCIEELDVELAATKAKVESARREGITLRAQMAEREKYWLQRDAQWEAKLKQAIAVTALERRPSPAPEREGQHTAQSLHQVNSAESSSNSSSPEAQQSQAHPAPRRRTSRSSSSTASTPAFCPNASASFSNTPLPSPMTAQPSYAAHAHGAPPPPQQPVQPPQPKAAMTLKQVKSLIGEVYASYDALSKSLADSHLLKLASRKETLLQHLHSFLTHRFGIKSLILDATSALLTGLRRFESDHTVAVFGAILRHSVEDDFRHTEERTHSAVRQILRAHLKQRYPLKRDSSIQALLDERVKGSLSDAEYALVVERLFAPDDRTTILSSVDRLGQQENEALWKQQQQQRGGFLRSQALPPPSAVTSLRYSTFVNLLLDFQFSVHRRFLDPFVALFRQFDTTHSGLLSSDQFHALATQINPAHSDESVDALLMQADPYQHDLVSFSDCVTVLAEDLKLLASSTYKVPTAAHSPEQTLVAEEETTVSAPEDASVEASDAEAESEVHVVDADAEAAQTGFSVSIEPAEASVAEPLQLQDSEDI